MYTAILSIFKGKMVRWLVLIPNTIVLLGWVLKVMGILPDFIFFIFFFIIGLYWLPVGLILGEPYFSWQESPVPVPVTILGFLAVVAFYLLIAIILDRCVGIWRKHINSNIN